jgi:hypothetical protein
MNAPNWVWVALVILIVLAILFLVGIRVHVGG